MSHIGRIGRGIGVLICATGLLASTVFLRNYAQEREIDNHNHMPEIVKPYDKNKNARLEIGEVNAFLRDYDFSKKPFYSSSLHTNRLSQ